MTAHGRRRRLDRERAARARRTANAARPRQLPVTQASAHLAAVLDEAGLPELADAARRLEFDEHYARNSDGLLRLWQMLMLADRPDLADRAKAGEFDATKADRDAFFATPAGRRDAAETEALLASLPPDLVDGLNDVMRRLGDDPAAQERLMKPALARMLDDLGLSEQVPDDDDVVDPADVQEALHPMLGQRGPGGFRLDTPEILACAELIVGTGGRDFEIGFERDHVPAEQAGWYVSATYSGHLIKVGQAPGPNQAARAMSIRLLDGSKCLTCGGVVTLDPRGRRVADKELFDGTSWSREDQLAAAICVRRRVGPHWQPCQRRTSG